MEHYIKVLNDIICNSEVVCGARYNAHNDRDNQLDLFLNAPFDKNARYSSTLQALGAGYCVESYFNKRVNDKREPLFTNKTDFMLTLNKCAADILTLHGSDFPEIPSSRKISKKEVIITSINWNIDHNKIKLHYDNENLNMRYKNIFDLHTDIENMGLVDTNKLQSMKSDKDKLASLEKNIFYSRKTCREDLSECEITLGNYAIKELIGQGLFYDKRLGFDGYQAFTDKYSGELNDKWKKINHKWADSILKNAQTEANREI